MATETKRGGMMMGLLIGGAIGAVTSLLMAPKTGVQMRQDLSQRYRNVTDKTQELATTVSEKGKEIASTVGVKGKEIASTVTGQASDLLERAKESKQVVMESLQQAKESRLQQQNATGSEMNTSVPSTNTVSQQPANSTPNYSTNHRNN